MNTFALSMMLGCAAGTVGTGLGGVLAYTMKQNDRSISRLMGASAGLMLSVVIFSLIPESLALCGVEYLFLGMAAGAGFIIVCGKLLEKCGALRLGLLLFCGIALHNFPEGIAVGAGLTRPEEGLRLALLIVIHDIPEGMAVSLPLKNAGRSPILPALLSGLPTVLGAVIGRAIGGISQIWVGLSLAFAAGAMAQITLKELFPESREKLGKKEAFLCAAAGMIIGTILILVTE